MSCRFRVLIGPQGGVKVSPVFTHLQGKTNAYAGTTVRRQVFASRGATRRRLAWL
jgi:hypothetical protein